MSDFTPPELKSRPSVWARIVFIVVALFTLWHIFASFLWISPVTHLRDLVPGKQAGLQSYMIPWFGQSWSVFAPEPINGSYTFKVRAQLYNEEDRSKAGTTTAWVDATKAEYTLSEYNLFPPRAANMALQEASKLFKAYNNLSDAQKEVAAKNYYKGDVWLGRLLEDMKAEGGEKNLVPYIVQERYADAYATQVAYAVWGEDRVATVQFSISRQNIVEFEDRHKPDAKLPPNQLTVTGWRGLITMPDQSSEAFRQVFIPALVKSGQIGVGE